MADMPIEPPPPANRDTSEEDATADMIAASASNGGSGLEQPHTGGANPLAVAGFVCAMCTVVLIWFVFVNLILGVLGLIFSWIGFNRAKKQGLKHRGLALAGLIVAPIALILSAVLIVAVLVDAVLVDIVDELVGYESHEINEHEIVLSESSYSTVSVGGSYTCAIDTTRKVTCWDGGFSSHSPVLGEFVAISVGDDSQSCAIRVDGIVVCWGTDYLYSAVCSLSDCRESIGDVMESPREGEFVAISSGTGHTCGITASGEALCWRASDFITGKTDAPSGRFIDISVGDDYSCGLRDSGRAICWFHDDTRSWLVPPAIEFSSISSSRNHSCGIVPSGRVRCWGSAAYGPTSAPEGKFNSIAMSDGRACGITSSGEISCWGGGSYPTFPAGEFTAVAVGDDHLCGIRAQAEVVCWQNRQDPVF